MEECNEGGADDDLVLVKVVVAAALEACVKAASEQIEYGGEYHAGTRTRENVK